MLVIRPRDDDETPDLETRLSCLIVPLDGSPVAEQILLHVEAVAVALELPVILVRVTPAPSDYYRYMEYPIGQYQDFSKEVDDAAVKYVEDVAKGLKQKGVKEVEQRLVHGQPAASIVDMAKDTPGSLVAMTTHGRSGVGRWVLGSAADRVVRHSGSPVLLIRAADIP